MLDVGTFFFGFLSLNQLGKLTWFDGVGVVGLFIDLKWSRRSELIVFGYLIPEHKFGQRKQLLLIKFY